MAGVTKDDVEGRQEKLIVPQFALRTNVEKFSEVEKRRTTIIWEEFELQGRAIKVTDGLYNYVRLLLAFTAGISFYVTSKTSPTTAFAISTVMMCLFLAGAFIYIGMAKSRITRLNRSFMILMQRYEKVRADARVLMKLEQNRERRQAANDVDNNEDPRVSMDSFIDSIKIICDGTTFSDFEKHHYMTIHLSLVSGGLYILLVLLVPYWNFFYGQDSSSPLPYYLSSVGGHISQLESL